MSKVWVAGCTCGIPMAPFCKIHGKPTTLIQNEGFVSGKDGWSMPMNIDSKHKNIIDDIIDLQKDSDLYQEKIATLDKENQDLFSVNMKLMADNAALRKALEQVKQALSLRSCSHSYETTLIEQTLSKGETE